MARIAARLAARTDDGDNIDNKALGQPFKYMGKKDSDFAELDQNVPIFMGARFGQELFDAMSWAKRQREPIVENTTEDRFIAYSSVYGADADDIDRKSKLGKQVAQFECVPRTLHEWRCERSCTGGESHELEAWRTLHQQARPNSEHEKSDDPWTRAETTHMRQHRRSRIFFET